MGTLVYNANTYMYFLLGKKQWLLTRILTDEWDQAKVNEIVFRLF